MVIGGFLWLGTNSQHVGAQSLIETEFTPTVTATCKAGHMTIKVITNQSFPGAIHARDFRTNSCMSFGNGSTVTTLGINLLANQGSPDYCGVLVNNKTDERSVPIAVRIHRTLELADDKFYVITCGKAGFKNAKADVSRPDSTYGIRVYKCFAFNKHNSTVLIDDR
ncbi:hypothetical protein B566_EDAN014952, partial [Ephemera danica]